MGRPPSNGGPAFRFILPEVNEMEAILLQHNTAMPGRHILEALADKFSESPERKGKIVVQFKQIWNWFQNRRYALRARGNKAPGKLNVSSMPRMDLPNQMRNVMQPLAAPKTTHMTANQPGMTPAPSGILVPGVMRSGSDNSYLEFEAKSARDGAWYDVQAFLAHRNLEIGDPEVQVRFAGFEVEEDEWINVKKHVRQRSLPCEASECVAVLAGDLVLCFQEGKDQALYFDATVLDAQRRRHDVRGCRCRFLVRYSHDLSEQEIVPLRKICRRPETDYRLQQLHNVVNDLANLNQHQIPALDAAAKTSLSQSGASVPIVAPEPKDRSLSTTPATSVQPSSNAAAVPAGSA
ncbi:PREDICTED: protein SAWADEE HOMEODOMAIN HOMOLOG 2-like isoform X1 [Camelina sativa]|uniref:Protein SAWADEE HOMEODOMAIN HOMOLOG 2-like isoform X1 n=2 Tax=Camelina sativa TaxID=90675 RepID=A0ABM0XLM0_CAMSA|nr:PREDICTED: protein SAWADEE HOMEODOMAIN HOMOLOG 2-like isoform X1 [Camelina sativa]